MAKAHLHHLTNKLLLTRRKTSPRSMHAPGVKGHRTWQQQPTGIKGSGTRSMGKDLPFTVVEHAQPLPLFLSLSLH
jgi:hypothetical protein